MDSLDERGKIIYLDKDVSKEVFELGGISNVPTFVENTPPHSYPKNPQNRVQRDFSVCAKAHGQ